MSRQHAHDRPAILVTLIALIALFASCGGAPDATVAPVVTGEPPTDRVPVIVDTDLDVSDVAALAILVRDPGVDLRAITIVPTGTGVTDCASARRVLGYILEELGLPNVPSACGREDAGPDGRAFPPEWRSDANGGWGMTMPPRPQTELPAELLTMLGDAVDDSPSAPTIVALGPWTNLEDAITADATFADRIAGIHAMAGAVDVPGNVVGDDVTAVDGLEWNLAADPSAVAVVLGTATPISIVPLDATDDVPVPADLADRLDAASDGAGADLVRELLLRVPARVGDGQQLWDELAALALTDPDLVTWEDADLLADERGRLTRDEAGRPVRFAVAADREAVEAALVAALARGPARATPFELAGTLTVGWDGSSCTMTATGGPTPGVASLVFENATGDPAGVQIIGVVEPHTWPEVQALLATVDIESGALPDWIVEAGGANDEAGSGVPVRGSVRLDAGTYGPVCIVGTWPDLTLRAGEPIVVSAP